MAAVTIFLVVLILVVAIWVLVELKRFRHKMFAIFLIILILFTYLSFIAVIKGKNFDLKTTEGLKSAGKLYVVWIGSVFQNIKTITANAIHMNWRANETLVENKNKTKSK